MRYVLETLRRELDEVMALVGCDSLGSLDRNILWRRDEDLGGSPTQS